MLVCYDRKKKNSILRFVWQMNPFLIIMTAQSFGQTVMVTCTYFRCHRSPGVHLRQQNVGNDAVEIGWVKGANCTANVIPLRVSDD